MKALITAEQIADLLPIVADRQWRISETGRIRDAEGFCPACAVLHAIDPKKCDVKAYPWALFDASDEKQDAEISRFVKAADGCDEFWLRQRIVSNLEVA